jgi:hypothetical protein
MDALQLYRLLQDAAGRLNRLVVGLYKGDMPYEDAVAQARKESEALYDALHPEASNPEP